MKVLIFLAMLFFSFGSANELSLDEEISLMRAAPAEQRYELMNNIKKRIASMNGAKRAEAISKITHNFKQGRNAPMHQNINFSIHNATSKPQGMLNKQTAGNPQKQNPKQMNKHE